jgi:hypothetical protein
MLKRKTANFVPVKATDGNSLSEEKARHILLASIFRFTNVMLIILTYGKCLSMIHRYLRGRIFLFPEWNIVGSSNNFVSKRLECGPLSVPINTDGL